MVLGEMKVSGIQTRKQLDRSVIAIIGQCAPVLLPPQLGEHGIVFNAGDSVGSPRIQGVGENPWNLWHLTGGSQQLASPRHRSGYLLCGDYKGLWFILSVPTNSVELTALSGSYGLRGSLSVKHSMDN